MPLTKFSSNLLNCTPGILGVLVLRREVEAAAAEVHRGLDAGAEGDLHGEGARPDDEAGGKRANARGVA